MIFCCQCFPSSRVAAELERPETTWSDGRKPPEIEVMVRDQTTYDHGESKVRSVAPEGARPMDRPKSNTHNNIAAETFTFRELATATNNFKHDCLVGEGAFGRVYRGNLQRLNRVVAVKQLDRNGLQGDKDFLMEVMVLSHLHHQNLVNLIGYCTDREQRLLVYDYMPLGSLQNHLFGISSEQRPIDWFTRMKIALGAAKGLEYLHNKANPQFIYRDLKSCSILLDDDFNAKLSGLAKRGSTAEERQITVTGTYGYSAPEQERAGQVTAKSDVYSFGVVLLELITGRAAVAPASRSSEEQNLVKWAQPMFRDPSRYAEMADPRLGGGFPESGLKQAVGVAVMCLQEEAEVRPLIIDVVNALSILGADPAAAPSAMIRS